MDFGGWLRNLGFGRYEAAFVENAIDSDVLTELTEADLKKLGIPLGDRKRLIKAIRAMRVDAAGPLTSDSVGEDAQSGPMPPLGPARSGGDERCHGCLSCRLRPYRAGV
jgi:hypothetical protein